jgi:hypothetical protein
VVELYGQRADTENVFDELKNQWGFKGFCTQQAHATALAARVRLVVYNLWNLFWGCGSPNSMWKPDTVGGCSC